MYVLVLCVISFIISLCRSTAVPFDREIAGAAVWFSADAYCPLIELPTRDWVGPTTGFTYVGTILDAPSDTQGYFGVHHRSHSVWIVFRGTTTARDWMSDAALWQVPEWEEECMGCMVHFGFKKCKDAVLAQVTAAVQQLLQSHPNYRIIITGHSLGGAIASLIAVDLAHILPSHNIVLYTFGSPRVGNAATSAHANAVLPRAVRITHLQDVVPHLPTESRGYVHFPHEVYEDENHQLVFCEGADDAACAEQWKLRDTNAMDHMLYLNHGMHCDSADNTAAVEAAAAIANHLNVEME